MALEAIVRQDPAEIGVVREEDAVHVPRLALKPIRAKEERRHGRNRRNLVAVRANTNARVVPF